MTATATILESELLEPDRRPADDPYSLDLPDLAPVAPAAPSPPPGRPSLRVLPGGGVDRAAVAEGGAGAAGSAERRQAGGPDPMVEIHRRRRFLAALALTVIILALSQALGISLTSFGPTPGTAAGGGEGVPIVHVVRPGDTYPGIAATLGVDDPQTGAVALVRANGGAELVVGQRLVIDPRALASGSG